jgi:hypothetical protein
MPRHYSPPEVLQMLLSDARDPRFMGTPFQPPEHASNVFGIRAGDGYAAVFGFENDGDPMWWLRIASGIALDVSDVDGALRWVNEMNRGIYTGCYLCAINHEAQRAALAYQISFPSVIIDSGSELLFSFMTNMMVKAARIAAIEAPQFIEKHGGRPFDEDLVTQLLIPMIM